MKQNMSGMYNSLPTHTNAVQIPFPDSTQCGSGFGFERDNRNHKEM